MSHYGLLGKYQFHEAAEDIRGSALYGRDDEKLGKIVDVIFDHGTGNIGYIVVDTGGWLTTKKFVVPADGLRSSTTHEDDFNCELTKQQIESFPPYSESDVESPEKWTEYEGKYRSKWETSPVMHRAETDRNVTPTTQQLEGNLSSLQASGSRTNTAYEITDINDDALEVEEEDLEAASASTGRIIPAGRDSVIIDSSASGIGGCYDTFQANLRERRKEAVAECKTCSIGPTGAKSSESADTLKKAV